MFLDFLRSVFRETEHAEAIIHEDKSYDYAWLLKQIEFWQARLFEIRTGSIVILEADYSPNAIALLLALIDMQCIIVPLTSSVAIKKSEFIDIAQGQISIIINSDDSCDIKRFSNYPEHPIYEQLWRQNHPGLLLFSSGSTGKHKAAVHDLSKVLEKYKTRRHNLRTLAFLLFDHIGGIDTLFYALSNGSSLITTQDRSPENICRVIEKYKIEVLPASPSFLNLLLLSRAYHNYDLSSLKYITYGAEVMAESRLKQCVQVFPNVTFLQKYGATEVGTLRSKSKSSDSVWVKIGGEGYQTRIVDGLLQIKANSAMVGYLNAPSPFTNDGWFITGDRVEVQGEYMRILGRESEIINVGGEKVYPSEVENVIHEFDNIAEVTVFAEKNPLLGNIVCAKVTAIKPVNEIEFAAALKKYCYQRLQSYKVPVKIYFSNSTHHSMRYKKLRSFVDKD